VARRVLGQGQLQILHRLRGRPGNARQKFALVRSSDATAPPGTDVHAVALTGADGLRPVGFVSDLDIAAAAASGEQTIARQAAASQPVTVSADESIHGAARLMSEHGVSHLIVLDAASGYPGRAVDARHCRRLRNSLTAGEPRLTPTRARTPVAGSPRSTGPGAADQGSAAAPGRERRLPSDPRVLGRRAAPRRPRPPS